MRLRLYRLETAGDVSSVYEGESSVVSEELAERALSVRDGLLAEILQNCSSLLVTSRIVDGAMCPAELVTPDGDPGT